ncbi:MAG: hypothetical protein FWC20_05660 [Oscillospiraceae bacterium]|nr:hypothetical protein [Oscillospiraceae bacterium]MCL2278879.1 hypothetical protein [Oscillospiraceae bacterium]
MLKNEQGHIVVETVGTFIPFTLLVISILSLVNIVTMQARVHNALTQTANAISMYSYVLKITGVADELIMLDSKASEGAEMIDAVLSGINAFPGSSGFDANSGTRALDAAAQAAGDPRHVVQSLANYGINELRNTLSAEIIRPMVMRFLSLGDKTGEEYLESVRVVSFDLTDSVIIDRNENIKLTVHYEVQYTFGALRIPFTPTLRITQTAVTKAWLGGSGEGYRG